MLSTIPQMSQKQFEQLCRKVYDHCGINLKAGKEQLVQSRLSKRLHALRLSTFEEYFSFLENDREGREMVWMIDSITTNKTSFLREIQHFDYLSREVIPKFRKKPLRIWSAACSTGEEPYTIAMLLRDEISNVDSWDIKILATDISTQVLQKAAEAVYDEEILEPVPAKWRQKYFANAGPKKWQVVPEVRNMVRLARLNLMERFPMRGPFDFIFCRNAMIYFDKPTQEKLVQRFYELLAPGGYLMVGHSESLTGAAHKFEYIQPATYQK
jgi:chemotaxis protein methyltransferase CheR